MHFQNISWQFIATVALHMAALSDNSIRKDLQHCYPESKPCSHNYRLTVFRNIPQNLQL